MTKQIELLAPGGSVAAIKAAIAAGANAVYCGLESFNARNRAANLSFDELCGLLRLAHQNNCKVFLTLNVVILEHELVSIVNLLNQLVNTTVDGIIVQDLGLFYLVQHYFPTLDIHASTQLTTHNAGQVKFLRKIGASRTNLSRELNLQEISELTDIAHQHDLLTEVFVHGALCVAFSGQCYSSSVSVGNSGNRGRCSQACRDEYEVTPSGSKFPLNLKDNSAYFDLPELVDAQVDSLKIEGRIKGENYVHTVVDNWRKNIDKFIETGKLLEDDANLHKVFNRGYTNSFLKGNISQAMFTENPRDNSFNYANKINNADSAVQIFEVQKQLSKDRKTLGAITDEKISQLSIAKIPLTFCFSGKLHQPLTLTITSKDKKIVFNSSSHLIAAQKSIINQQSLEKRFKNFNNANYVIAQYQFEQLEANLTLPFKELTELKNQVAYSLNDSNDVIAPITLPKLKRHSKVNQQTRLSILISDEKDLYLCQLTNADIYFKLPESYQQGCRKYIDILKKNPRLIPWFPAILIGKDYNFAADILTQVKPKKIITNNTGIAFKANELNITWIAGPFLNTTNSYALRTLHEQLNCAGAFISNEISRLQIRNISRPKDFKLIYSIYHPVLMMTSRQCFFQQTVGCKKPAIVPSCMQSCTKATSITNLKGHSFAVDKQKGGYPSICNDQQFLNTDVVNDFAELFDEFFIDLTNIGTGSRIKQDKTLLIKYFEDLIAKVDGAPAVLNQFIPNSTNSQYQRGL